MKFVTIKKKWAQSGVQEEEEGNLRIKANNLKINSEIIAEAAKNTRGATVILSSWSIKLKTALLTKLGCSIFNKDRQLAVSDVYLTIYKRSINILRVISRCADIRRKAQVDWSKPLEINYLKICDK